LRDLVEVEKGQHVKEKGRRKNNNEKNEKGNAPNVFKKRGGKIK
jgi:hypothetical protein